jgi:hypothetical protein
MASRAETSQNSRGATDEHRCENMLCAVLLEAAMRRLWRHVRRIWLKQRHLPEVLCNRDRRNLHIGPPGHFVAMAVQIPVMFAAQRDGKFVTNLAPQ